jgi:signal transduction histidine kinase
MTDGGRIHWRELLFGVGGSLAVLVVLLQRPPFWEVAALIGATLLPATLILYGGTAARRAKQLEGREATLLQQREILTHEARRLEESRAQLQDRIAELTTVNEIGAALGSTLHLEETLDIALHAVVSNLPFDRALVMLVDETRRTLGHGRSIGGPPDLAERIAALELGLDDSQSTLVQLANADGPMLFRGADEDPYEPNRAMADVLGVSSYLGTPLLSSRGAVGVLAVDNRLSGRDREQRMGPLLFTLGSLLAASIENARLYEEIEAHNRELEAQVTRRTAQLAEAVEEAHAARATAEAASATKSRFLANVSHELRTPLTSVVGFTKIVRKRLDEVVFPAVPRGAGPGDASTDPKLERAVRQVSENLAIMIAEGDRLTAMINDVLDLEKIEAGRMEFRQEPVDLAAVLDRAMAAVSALFETTGLELVREVEPNLPPITGDRDRLIQVVINLLSNAVKFTPTGSVTCRATLGSGEIVVSVIDTGIGIDPADHAKVFEQFGQAGDTLTEKPRGTGLGLPISRQIVEHHGGGLWLESARGAGSTFAFSLPVTATLEAPPDPHRSEPADPTAAG